jgi:hypothetical protein
MPRPYAQYRVEELESLAEETRGVLDDILDELGHRRGRRVRRLRRELDPSVLEDHCVYVIELRSAIWDRSDFLDENPEGRREYPCLYVGMTSKTPEARFGEHVEGGDLSSKKVAEYGVQLRPEFYERLNPMTREEATKEEEELAEALRRSGYGVWWN